jgi:dihydrofolate reductase
MRRIRYRVAMSLDGYLAGPNGEIDWITMDPEIDFADIFSQFDTLLIGRKTFEVMVNAGRASTPGMKTVVFSRTLTQWDHPDVTIIAADEQKKLTEMKASLGKDIWLFGGGSLFRNLEEVGLVDTVEVTVVPILLGAGIPLLPGPASRIKLSLTAHRVYKSGILSLEYAIKKAK